MLFFNFTNINLLIHFGTYEQMVSLWEGDNTKKKKLEKLSYILLITSVVCLFPFL